MTTQKTECEVFMLIDTNGDYAVGKDEAEAREQYEEHIQALSECDGFRLVKLTLSVPLPEVVELTGDVPALDADAAPVLSVK